MPIHHHNPLQSPSRAARPRWPGPLGLVGLGVLLAAACTYDSNDRCDDGQVMYGDNLRCVCAPNSVLVENACVPCGDNEVAGPTGCVCAPGFNKPAGAAACLASSEALGLACDTAGAPCTDPTYSHCETAGGTSGYCTKQSCTGPADCEGGYACDTSVSPSVCRRPPVGAGASCATDADCAGTEATYCDAFMSQTCMVQGCTVDPNNCFAGTECCDLSAYGVPQPLCIPEGGCTP